MKAVRVLIVDDSSVMRKIAERCLRQAGIEIGEVVEAGDGVQVLAAVQESPMDLILTDINMPVMTGLEFLERLSSLENAQNTPVVMITTEGAEAHVMQAISAGARGYIRKPFTLDQVKERITPLLELIR